MKNYLKALQDYENTNNNFALLNAFITTKNSDLIKLYCDGKIHLPSPMLLKKIYFKFKDLVIEDKELEMLFANIIQYSKLFYAATINLVKESNEINSSFEIAFTNKSQSLGQQLITLLINIKYRIKIVRFRRQKSNQVSKLQVVNLLSELWKPIINNLNDYFYRLKLAQSSNNSLSQKIYYLIIILTLSGFWATNSFLLDNASIFITIFTNLIYCAIISLLSALTYSAGYFGHIGIDGKNIVAYRYQVFFNNISNKKMYRVFKLLHDDDDGQKANISIESA